MIRRALSGLYSKRGLTGLSLAAAYRVGQRRLSVDTLQTVHTPLAKQMLGTNGTVQLRYLNAP